MRFRRKSGPASSEPGRDRTPQDEWVEASGAGAMAAKGDIVNSSTHVHQAVPLPRADLVAPPRGLPPAVPPLAGGFVGRGGKLAELDAALAGPGGTVVQAVHGLSGVGKSALAAHWALQHADAHVLTWWITADSAESIVAGLADLAGMLVPEMTRTAPAGAVPLEERAGWARRWLATHTSWLVVLDNVTRPGDVAELVAGAPGGRFLLTSRLREGWHDIVPALIELDVLSPAEAHDLLTGTLTTSRPATAADLEGVAEVCEQLGHLPLAVKQAAAFMAETATTPRDYRRLLGEYPAELYAHGPAGADGDRTVARVWHATLDHLAAETPQAGPVLRVLAWFAPDHIPRPLLDPLADQWGGPVTVRRAVGRLAAYNMITLTPRQDGDVIGVHRLVQALARIPDPADPHRRHDAIATARQQATHTLNHHRPADPKDPSGWPTWQTLLPHIDALTTHAPPDTDTNATDLLLTSTGRFLDGQGATHRAITYHQRSLTTAQRLYGPDHPFTLTSRDNLAYAYKSAGDLGRAIPMYEQTLNDYVRVLGPEHPTTRTVRENLFAARGEGPDED
ncbi:hypothetical protein GCM10010182_00580 [Actinomadura cremea]|nr:hypothetical protein GCM10010182_00580 [Actinomadura cremea]